MVTYSSWNEKLQRYRYQCSARKLSWGNSEHPRWSLNENDYNERVTLLQNIWGRAEWARWLDRLYELTCGIFDESSKCMDVLVACNDLTWYSEAPIGWGS